MGLVDLPTEVFQDIVHILVRDVGVSTAFKYRHVCRWFASEIYEDVVARQDLTWVFDNYTDSFTFVGSNFFFCFGGDILHRRLPIHSSEGFTFIKELTRALLELEGSGSAVLEEQYTRDICRAFSGVRKCPNSIHRWAQDTGTPLHESESSDSDSYSNAIDQDLTAFDPDLSPPESENSFSLETGSEDASSCARYHNPAEDCAVGNLDLLQSLISCPEDFNGPLWMGFPTPLEAAIANDRIEIVQYILEYAFSSTRTNYQWDLHNALHVAIRKSRTAIGNLIIDRIVRNREEYTELDGKESLEDAIGSCMTYGNYELLPRLLPPRSEDLTPGDAGWTRDEETWVRIHHDFFMRLYRDGRNIGGLVAAYGYDFIDHIINMLGVDPPPKLDKILHYERSYHTRPIRWECLDYRHAQLGEDGHHSTAARSRITPLTDCWF